MMQREILSCALWQLWTYLFFFEGQLQWEEHEQLRCHPCWHHLHVVPRLLLAIQTLPLPSCNPQC